MLWKILTILFFILALPVILLATFVSLALFGQAKECPATSLPSGAPTLEQVSKDLERTGIATITQEQLTVALNQNFGEKVKNLRVCFDNQKINLSGSFPLGSFTSSFYASTKLESGNRLELKDTKIAIGALGFQPFTDIFGGIGQRMLNDQLSQMPQEDTYKIEYLEGKIKIEASQKPRKR